MNSIAAEHDIEEFALAAVDLDDRTILDRINPSAARVQAYVGTVQCAGQNLKQIGTMNLKPAGTETLGHGALRLGAEQNLPGHHVARQHEPGFEAQPADGILQPDFTQDFCRIGCDLNTGADFFQPVRLFEDYGFKPALAQRDSGDKAADPAADQCDARLCRHDVSLMVA